MNMADLIKSAGFTVSDNDSSQNDKNNMKKGKQSYKSKGSNTVNHGENNHPGKGKHISESTLDFVHAPYNFVPFSKTVLTQEKSSLIPHNCLDEQLYTGEISYNITAKTPIFIDNGKGEFHQTLYGDYSIPGSTVRGLIRNNVQILGLSSFSDDIDDYSLMYRNVAAGLSQDKYKEILGSKSKSIAILENVRAGYISNENGKYVIYNTIPVSLGKDYGIMNYYPLSEKTIIYDYLKSKKNGKYSYEFFNPDNNILQNQFMPFEKYFDKNNRLHYAGKENPTYLPYYKKISYEIKDLKTVTKVGKPGKYSKEGYVISSGFMKEKKALYIIPKIDRTEKITIGEEDIQSFVIDYNKRKNKLPEKDRTGFFNLPSEGETKPVFFIKYNGKLYFGFTPRLRVFYNHSIKNGLPEEHENSIVDYAKSIFGYTDDQDQDSYKSKVSFTDAVYSSEDEPQFLVNRSVIQGEPNPTAILQYVKQNSLKGNITYDSENFELRGVKQYWIQPEVKLQNKAVNENISSSLHPMEQGSRFSGKIRFHNLKKDELGLLLWSVKLKPESWMNIGKAKAYGYGAIDINITAVKTFNPKLAYKTTSLVLKPYDLIDTEEFISYYKATVKQRLGNKDIEDLESIQEFFIMKDSTNMPEKNKTEYMTLKEFKLQSSKKYLTPLPSPGKVVSKQ